ncbi:unnamed protein product [Cunninghamella echinulata]
MDISKQLIGSIFVHSLNVIAAYLFGLKLEEGEQFNPCVWYWLNIFVDTTLGTVIIWGFLQLSQKITKRYGLSGFQSGVYGTPPLKKQLKRWLKQLIVYVSALLTMKLIVVTLFHVCPWIEYFGEWILGWTKNNYKLQVVFVMLLFPLIMNILQFWIIDTIVKHNVHNTPIYLDDALDEDILIPIYDNDEDDTPSIDDDNNHYYYQDDHDNQDNYNNINHYRDDDDDYHHHLSSWPLHLTTLQDDEQDAVSLTSHLSLLNHQHLQEEENNTTSHVKTIDPF